jgi:hypothetical protein
MLSFRIVSIACSSGVGSDRHPSVLDTPFFLLAGFRSSIVANRYLTRDLRVLAARSAPSQMAHAEWHHEVNLPVITD